MTRGMFSILYSLFSIFVMYFFFFLFTFKFTRIFTYKYGTSYPAYSKNFFFVNEQRINPSLFFFFWLRIFIFFSSLIKRRKKTLEIIIFIL